jgi:hypothetical protein
MPDLKLPEEMKDLAGVTVQRKEQLRPKVFTNCYRLRVLSRR